MPHHSILILSSIRLTISWLFSQLLAQRINAGYTVTQSNTTGKPQTPSTAERINRTVYEDLATENRLKTFLLS